MHMCDSVSECLSHVFSLVIFSFYCLSYSVFIVFAYLFSNEGEKNGYGFGWADGKDLERVGRREIVTGIYHMKKSIFDKFKIIFNNHLVCMNGILKQQEKNLQISMVGT